MIVRTINAQTLSIEPESVAEIELLRTFEGHRVVMVEADPFAINAPRLEIQRVEQQKEPKP